MEAYEETEEAVALHGWQNSSYACRNSSEIEPNILSWPASWLTTALFKSPPPPSARSTISLRCTSKTGADAAFKKEEGEKVMSDPASHPREVRGEACSPQNFDI